MWYPSVWRIVWLLAASLLVNNGLAASEYDRGGTDSASLCAEADASSNVRAGSWAAGGDSRDPTDATIRAHRESPRLMLTRAQITALKEKIERVPWARSQWESILGRADSRLSEPVVLPPRGGTWWHYYVSPKDGQRLVKGRRIGQWQWEHISSTSGEMFLGDTSDIRRDYDGVALIGVHDDWSTGVRDLGMAYQLTGETRYAKKAREILLAYADRYLGYPILNKQGRPGEGEGGRVTKQSLSEAGWIIPLVQGADLIWETLSVADRRQVSNGLFLPAVRDVILAHRYNRAHNIQCWKNAAVGLIGLLLGETELVWEAVNNSREGYFFQLREGLTPDGHWFERSPSYHFYALQPILILARALANSGIDPRVELIKALLDAPFQLAKPDLTLPRYNDSHPVDLRRQTGIYEWGYATFRDTKYLTVLHEAARRGGVERAPAGRNSLLFGVPQLPPAPPVMPPASRDYPGTGYAVLARSEGPETIWLGLKYDPHVKPHSHFDKLSFELYGGGAPVSEDPGITGYGAPVYVGWYKTTLAHNTLVVDEQEQRATEGKSLAFGSDGGVDYAVLDAGDLYEGTTFRRTAALLDSDLVLFIDQVRTNESALLDLAFHPNGELVDAPAGQTWIPSDTIGYRYLKDATIRPALGLVALRIRQANGSELAVTYNIAPKSDIITAIGPGLRGRPVPRPLRPVLHWALRSHSARRLVLRALR